MPTKNRNGIKVSKETLTHFQCQSCMKWWTIGDVPKTRHNWFCTWCGKKVKATKA